MTYFGFLALFLGIPIFILSLLTWYDRRQGKRKPVGLDSWPGWLVVAAHVVVAVVYTTPWDNYLVATSVWWYDPNLVTGLLIGWVPIEEYTFFVVQTIMTGLWILWLARHLAPRPTPFQVRRWLQIAGPLALSPIWFWSVYVLFTGWTPGTYLALILVWALPPVMFQLGFGADILWHHRWLVLLAWLPTSIYLSLADMVAINAGTWVISPEQTVGWLLGGILPIEEAIFFFMTNLLISLGIPLVLARESQVRAGPKVTGFLQRLVQLAPRLNVARS